MSAPVAKYHHPTPQRKDWETPPALFAEWHARFGFTLDACALPHNAKCARYFTPDDDGLAQDWGTETVWCNPPYGKEIPAWMRKAWQAAKGGATVVLLVPARTDSRWWHDYAMKGDVTFLRGRVKFVGAPYTAPFPCAVIVFPTSTDGGSMTEPRPNMRETPRNTPNAGAPTPTAAERVSSSGGRELPLLGSNQDSPDPESGVAVNRQGSSGPRGALGASSREERPSPDRQDPPTHRPPDEGSHYTAGQELNVAVAERVVGIVVKRTTLGTPYDPSQLSPWVNPERDLIMDGSWARAQIPPYSEGIAAAMLVVEAMRAKGFNLKLDVWPDATTGGAASHFFATYYRPNAGGVAGHASSPSAPLAICCAALAAVQTREGR